MDTKMVSQSVDEATKALKSRMTEGSSKLFGSMRDAKRGLLGGITSTFDHVVNIVGGPESGDKTAAGANATSASDESSNRPPFKRRNTNPFTEDYDPSLVESDVPPGSQTTADGATVVPTYQSVEPSRAWDNMGAGGTADGPRIPSGGASAFLAPQRRQRRGSDSDADSEATEGCDDVDDIDEGGLQGDGSLGPVTSDDALNLDAETLSHLDDATRNCVEFMKYFVPKMFDATAELSPTDKATFGELCQHGTGRLWFAKFVHGQMKQKQEISEQVAYSLVQFYAVVLFECNEAEDYGPAMTLMNTAFTFYHEVQEVVSQDANIFTKLWSRAQPKRKTYLYRYMTDQAIWQSPRFWSAAFFFAVQRERANKPTASCNVQKEEQMDDARFQQIIAFEQLRTFTRYMRALGVPKDQCLEFIRRQAKLANLSREQVTTLRDYLEQWTEESVTK